MTEISVAESWRLILLSADGTATPHQAGGFVDLLAKQLRAEVLPLSMGSIEESLSERVDKIREGVVSLRGDLVLYPAHPETKRRDKLSEKLLLSCPVPILRYAHTAAFASKGSPKILFPTDFHYEARKVIDRLIPFARRLGASVTLFHEVPRPAGSALEVGSAPEAFQVAWDDDREERRKIAERFAGILNAAGIPTSIELNPPGKVLVHAIWEAASSGGYAFIAVGARSGPIETYFTGLITRQLFSALSCPVWAIHERVLKSDESMPGEKVA